MTIRGIFCAVMPFSSIGYIKGWVKVESICFDGPDLDMITM